MEKAESKELKTDDECADLRVIAEGQGPSAVSKYRQEQSSRWKKEEAAFAINEMGKAESKELETDDECAELRVIAEEQGPSAVSKYRQEHSSRWKKEEAAFAITGRSATGKSTFINKMHDVKPGDIGFAKSGSGNTTKKPTAYKNPQNQRIVFYDLPGVGTMEFQKATYAEEIKLKLYDYFFIFFDKVISEDDYFLVCKLVELKKSFCLVRSKIDDDLRNAKDDGKREEEVIPAIRQQIKEQMSCDEQLKKSDAIFLISSKRKDIGDWTKLLGHIEYCLVSPKFKTFMYSLPRLLEKRH
ncbi:T-cell-specific guanine nucleotide triphosphate-binding protein 2-like [Mytilus californianus]|uniref:T-cell-specific guanine nucleotide triphosphate-binding protein 2-like n=1 Tax=Mytilus californianus TaxID=6549 RepID=UPI0022486151|nr:T-cell-specific guanine nucleotide triphosphate-binding protein 2-like [Mytilus californianus]